jgi:hypothetical protein
LANQGKSKAEIRNLIDKAFEYTQRYGYPESKNDTINSAVFLLAENGNIKNTEAGLRYGKYVDDFIDACIKERRIRHTEDDFDELYHYGILGQKWGIRRFQNPDGSLTAVGKIHYGTQEVGKKIRSTTSKVAKNIVNRKIEKYKEKHPNKMSDAELRDKINRIQMENQYREMMRQNNKPIGVGRKIALDILETSAKSLAGGLINRLNREWEEDAAYDRRVEYEKRDQKRAEARDKKTMSYKFDKYVEKTLPKKFTDFKQEDWENFDTFTNMKNRIREYEGGGQGKKNQKGKNK